MGKKFDPTFSGMKSTIQNLIREEFYFSQMLICDRMMFTYEGLPDSIDTKFLEDYLNISGACGIGKKDDGTFLICPYGAREGRLNQYGLGENLVGNTMNGEPITGKIGVDCAIIYNSSSYTPSVDNFIDADALAQIDKSAGVNVRFSRVAPVYGVPNDTVKEGMKAIMGKVLDGDLEVLTSENIIDALSGIDGSIKTIDVTHPEKIQYIQYLAAYYDDIVRRHFSRRGLTVRTGTKAAQQSVQEINGFDAISWFYPLDKLAQRKKGIEMFNKVFNENASVRFSDLWAQEYAAYTLRNLQDDIAAESAAESVKEGEENAETVPTEKDSE